MTLLIDVYAKKKSRRIQLEEGEEIVVGRENSDVVLFRDRTLSRQHFSVSYLDKTIVVRHLSQTNPTLMAVDGSDDFQKVAGKQSDRRSCRIMAGSHKFVVAIEIPGSATISGDCFQGWTDEEDRPREQRLPGRQWASYADPRTISRKAHPRTQTSKIIR